MVEDLGKRWMLRELCIKKYPVCFTMHRYIDMVIALKRQHNLSLEGVDRIEVHAKRSREEICNRPNPQSEGDLQFSFQHNLAVAMQYGDVTGEHINPSAITDEKFKEARNKVRFIAAYATGRAGASARQPAHVAAFAPAVLGSPMQDAAHVVVRMKDGRTFADERHYPIGHPKEPLTSTQVRELCTRIGERVLTKADMAKTSQIILNLEDQNNIAGLVRLLG
jgi:2-methylcitrate dehydratase PrpD